MMHTNKDDPVIVYMDKRSDKELANTTCQYGSNQGKPFYPNWNPKVKTTQGDFRHIPFPNETFILVSFDPPHFIEHHRKGDMAKKFGVLEPETWQSDLKKGFAECWRVLKPYGVLIFKWSEHNRDVKEILRLFPVKPQFIQKTAAAKKKNGRLGSTLWCCFVKVPSELHVDTHQKKLGGL